MTDEQIYQTILGTCPELPHLVEDLDLVNPSTGRRYGVSEAEEQTRQKLVSVAHRVLNTGRIYTNYYFRTVYFWFLFSIFASYVLGFCF